MEKELSVSMPLFCPKCGQIMKKKLDKKMWPLHQMCFDCVIKMESHLKAEGKFEKYEQEKIEKNMIAYLKIQEEQAKEYLEGLKHISVLQNSHGDLEDWDINEEQIKEATKKYKEHLDEVRLHLKKIQGEK